MIKFLSRLLGIREPCRDPGHLPDPSEILEPKVHIHKCPKCGEITEIYLQELEF